MTSDRHPNQSGVITTHIVMPGDTNMHGTAFGGKIMQWMDIAASVAAGRHCGGASVTVSVDDLHFAKPIKMGDVVVFKACVNHAGRTSMEVGVRVEREDLKTRQFEHCLSGYFTFVAITQDGKPMPVPPLHPQTPIEIKRFKAAQQRQARRIQSRAAHASDGNKKA